MSPVEKLAIQVAGVSKYYKLYPRPSEILRELVFRRKRHSLLRALHDISFDIRRGEVVGIIGRNGAGKSTLLKVLTNVVDHDSGQIVISGKVAAILELGTGINGEYSGRDNIFFGGICRGMSARAMAEKMPQIIDFAELEDVIDRPFKTYSSGMQARLLFSTNIHIDADILIIDEALAAGDALFQEKCLSRIKQLAYLGKTILFVSHSIAMIQQLCTRGMLLHNGELVVDADTATVLHEYDQILAKARNNNTVASMQPSYVYGDGAQSRPELKAYVELAEIRDEDNRPTTRIERGRRYTVRLIVSFNRDIPQVIVGFRIHMPSGLVVYAIQNTLRGKELSGEAGETIEALFEWECRLQSGQYLLSCGVGEVIDASTGLYPAPFNELHIRNNVKVLNVTGTEIFGGLVDFNATIRFKRHGVSRRVADPV
jgi:lipopolysaccharide transport system ATP-binding protein